MTRFAVKKKHLAIVVDSCNITHIELEELNVLVKCVNGFVAVNQSIITRWQSRQFYLNRMKLVVIGCGKWKVGYGNGTFVYNFF